MLAQVFDHKGNLVNKAIWTSSKELSTDIIEQINLKNRKNL